MLRGKQLGEVKNLNQNGHVEAKSGLCPGHPRDIWGETWRNIEVTSPIHITNLVVVIYIEWVGPILILYFFVKQKPS
jgi:hypothetical protein